MHVIARIRFFDYSFGWCAKDNEDNDALRHDWYDFQEKRALRWDRSINARRDTEVETSNCPWTADDSISLITIATKELDRTNVPLASTDLWPSRSKQRDSPSCNVPHVYACTYVYAVLRDACCVVGSRVPRRPKLENWSAESAGVKYGKENDRDR